MSKKEELQQILQLFNVLDPLSDADRDRHLCRHPELSAHVVQSTLPLLQADEAVSPLPSLEMLLSADPGLPLQEASQEVPGKKSEPR